MKPSEYRKHTIHTDITRARIIVFFFWCLPIKDISLSAPGMADFSIFDKFLFAFLSFDVYPSSRAADSLPICIISLESSIVLSIPVFSFAKCFNLLLLSEDFPLLAPPPLDSPKQFCQDLNCVLISFCTEHHVSQLT